MTMIDPAGGAPSTPRLTPRRPGILGNLRLIHLVPILVLLVLSGWAIASPVGSAPDDDFHLTSIWCANGARTDLCLPGPTAQERIVPPAVLYAPCFGQDAKVTAVCQSGYLKQGSEPTVVTRRGNFENNYPPLYYATMNLFAGPDLIGSALTMRLVNILLFSAISTALWMLLPASRRTSLVWGWLITSVPLGLFILASNNPSSWAIMGVGFSWLALLGYFESRGRRRIGLGAIFGITALMAAGARGDAALYTVLGVAIAGFLTFRPTRGWLLPAILPGAMSIVAIVFFITSQQSGVISQGLGNGQTHPGALSDPIVLFAYNILSVPSLWAGVFGVGWGLGWLDTSMPAIVGIGALCVFIAVAFTGIADASRRKSIAVTGLAIVLWLLPTYVLVRGLNVVGENVQPRYLLPLIVIMGGLAVLPVVRRGLTFGRFQIAAVAVVLIIAQTVALHVNLRRYVTGISHQGWNLNSGIEWWWSDAIVSPMVVWGVGSLAFAALVFIVIREVTPKHEFIS